MKSRDDIFDLARTLARSFAKRAAAHDAAGTFAADNFEELRAAGYPLLSVPEAYGGWGASLSDCVRAQEILAEGDGSTALAISMHLHVIGFEADVLRWRKGTFAGLCAAVVERGALVNACATEPEQGSPHRGGMPKTTARKTSDVWLVNGRKNFATLAPALDYYLTPASVLGEEPQIGVFLVPRQPAVTIEETWDALGMRSTGSHDLIFGDALVDEDHVLEIRPAPQSSGSWRVGSNAWFTLCITTVYIGVAVAAHRFALEYARERVPTALGRSIGTLESIQRRLGESEVALHTARTLVRHAAEAWDRYPERREAMADELGMTKMVATNKAIEVVDNAMRVVGGASMQQEFPLGRYYRDVRGGLYHPPTDDATLPLLGRIALEREKQP